ncbi:hypothetical protein RP20_CCG017526 [Aedes albopictus]|nr:hypothetical protein RP20_CCG017526 [Aedes albopictus]
MNMGSQARPFRSAEAGQFMDFVDYGQRDMLFGGQGNPPAASRPPLTPSNSFPPIGTFTLDSTSMAAPPSQNNVFGGGDTMGVLGGSGGSGSIGVFNANAMMNMSGGGGAGGSGAGGSGGGSSANTAPGNSSGSYGSGGQSNSNGVDANQGTRETGIIEKLLHSYGFIQCCERQARLFFHFSQFGGTIEHLKIGDPVEFEMTYDRRTGKPIASQVSKIAPEVVLSEERVTGTVTTELKTESSQAASSDTTTGRISYENRGECFFLPYTKDDVEGNVCLRAGDKVSFQIATNQRGNLGACHIRLENPAHPVKYRGVVCSMKDTFGFIERADVVKEIFFHFSETDNTIELRPGDDVEFIIQTRNQGKEVACNIARLPPGSVIFEDVDSTIYKGQVLKSLDRNNQLRQQNNDPLPGRIRYRAADHSEVEVPFGDKDQKGDFTLRHGDWVQFLLATDRRDQLQRATSISLLDETFQVSGEKREQGVVASLKEGFGFLRCVERNIRLFFHFTEVLDTSREICVDDEVEFTVIQDPGSSFANTRQSAIRIKHLPVGTVKFETLIESNVEGIVSREAPKSPIKSQERTEGGVISYGQGPNKKTIMYFLKDCDKAPRVGDKVRFNICQVKRNKELIATNIQEITNQLQHQSSLSGDQQQQGSQQSQQMQLSSLHNLQQQPHSPSAGMNNGNRMNSTSAMMKASYANGNIKPGKVHHGFIAVLKENFGFIETLEHDQEVFFHFSNFIGNTNALELGHEVEYSLSTRSAVNAGNCIPAENVKVIPKGSIPQPKVLPAVYNGVVLRPLRCINPDQPEYCGLVQVRNEAGEAMTTHEFGITSLKNKRDLLQKDDMVTFKVDEQNRAVEVTSIRTKKQAKVDSVKGLFGFLDFEVEEGKKLFFHMSEVQGGGCLYPGDSRNGKTSACNMIKVADANGVRAERLLSRIKLNSVDDSGPRLTVIRAPKGPDGTKGFHISVRAPRLVGKYH